MEPNIPSENYTFSEEVSPSGSRKYLKWTGMVFLTLLLSFLILIISLKWVNPPFTSFTLQDSREYPEHESYNLRSQWVSSGEIPDHLKWAVVASEDQRFFQHNGLDLNAIEEAVEEYERGEDLRGASTITQQVAKNLFLSPSKTYVRKGAEAVIAYIIDLTWSKDRILEVYLNIAEFGPGIFGVGRAVPHFYNKPVAELKPLESARLATVLPNPKRMRANPPSPFVRKRSQWVLRQMGQLNGKFYQWAGNKKEADSAGLAFQSRPLRGPDSLIQYIPTDSLRVSTVSDTLKESE